MLVSGPHRRRASRRCSASSPGWCRASPAATSTGDVLLDGVEHRATGRRASAPTLSGTSARTRLAGFVTDTVEEELAYGMEQLGLPAGDDAPPGRGDPRPARHRRPARTATCARSPAASSSGSRSARCSPCTRGCWCSTSRPRRSTRPPPRRCSATLTRLVHDLGVTVLLAEHRLERVVPFADRMVPADRRRRRARRASPAELLADSPVAPPVVELGRAAGLAARCRCRVRDARRRAARPARPRSAPRPSPTRRPAGAGAARPRGRRPSRYGAHGRACASVDLDAAPPARSPR